MSNPVLQASKAATRSLPEPGKIPSRGAEDGMVLLPEQQCRAVKQH